MNGKNINRVFRLKIQLTAAVFLLIIALLSGFFVFGPDLVQVARALSPNYSKNSGDQLTVNDWNSLPSDFLARTGGASSAMEGNLNMGNKKITNLAAPTVNGDAVNLLTLNSRLSGGKKIVCGETLAGNTAWQTYGTSQVTIRVDVDTQSASFTSEPIYMTNLSGTGNHFMTLGTQSVYSTSATGFTVYITKTTTPTAPLTNLMVDTLSPTLANGWGWHIHWCGIGN